MKKKSTYGLRPEQLARLFSISASGGQREADDKSGANGTCSPSECAEPEERLGFHAPLPEIDGYKILDKLGEAGQGQVWRALQLGTHREIALKVPRVVLSSSAKVLARFEREVEIAARLRHPHIARVHDSGVHQGLYYYTMDLVDGPHLDAYVEQHHLSERQILELMRTVCQAVQYAHQNGVIHRDLKPSNIVVTNDGQPCIVDFGLAKDLLETDPHMTLSEDGNAAGTPAYMSPEQAAGRMGQVDTRTDVYSLGAMLFALLTGEHPHDLSGSRGEVLRRIAEEDVRQPRKLNPGLSRDLESLLLKALDPVPDRRYTSAGELAEDMDNYLKGAPLVAGPRSSLEEMRRFVRRNKILVAGITIVLAVLSAGVVVSTLSALGQARARAEAQAIAYFLTNDVLASIEPLHAKGRDTSIRYVLDAAAENLKGKFEDQPLVEASINATLGWTYGMLCEYKKAEQHLKRASRIYQDRLGNVHSDTLECLTRLAWVYAWQGRYDEAERLSLEILDINRRKFGEKHRATLGIMHLLGGAVYIDQGRFTEAEQMLTAVVRISPGVLGHEDKLPLHATASLARTYTKQTRYDEASDLLAELVASVAELWGEEHPWTLVYTGFLAEIYGAQGQHEKALQLFEDKVDTLAHVWGGEHVYTLNSKHQLAQLYAGLSRYEDAERLYLETLSVARRVLGNDHYGTIVLTNALASLYSIQGRHGDAESLFRKTLSTGRQSLGENHPEMLAAKHGLGTLYVIQSRHREAESLLLDAFHGREAKLGLEHPHTLESLEQLVSLYGSWGKPDIAAKWRATLPPNEAARE